MKDLNSSEIRKMFLDYFEEHGHLIVPSASLIPDNDPSLLWINAGVAPLKKYFDGREKPPKNRLTNSQKCIRTNDIENVGKTARHHTFFEMLGNFSIGDYFRDEALGFAFELLTSDKYYGIDKDKLYMTVYPDDDASFKRWLELGVDASHIIKCEGNFWDIGPGPCGPDSEIFYDRGEKYDPHHKGLKLLKDDLENDRYIEIWNNVFSQYNHVEGLKRKDFPELPHKNIDTGMGLERLVCIIEGGETNYDTDLFLPIMDKIGGLTNISYNGQFEFKAIADHVKTLVFALSDGASFSNEGRGYVLRRILRRASRFGRKLGLKEPFMAKLTESVIEIMESYYPYLRDNKAMVDKAITKEEETFLKTLAAGEKRLDELTKTGKKITGEDVFKLYDTYGFPYELTEEILLEKDIKINKDEFDKCMEKQKAMAREAFKKVSGMNTQGDIVNFNGTSTFVGYDKLKTEATVIFTSDEDGKEGDVISSGLVVLDETPFYGTMGGQEGDTGTILGLGLNAEVMSTLKTPNKANACFVKMLEGTIKVGDKVTAEVDPKKRLMTCQNHTATHLLQKSLQEVLGSNVHQQGSFVDDEVLRFDFNYNGKITDEDIIKVEEGVNKRISLACPQNTKEMSLEDAKKTGAMALFSEKYGDVVRVVNFGDSTELCGGTHVSNTSFIKRFAIKSIESKGLNVYRIEGVCDENLEAGVFSMIKPYNDEMILLLTKAKKIVNEALKKGIKLDFNFNINDDKPLCYKDILFNKNEVVNLRKEVLELEKKYEQESINFILKDDQKYLENKKEGIYGEVLITEVNDFDMASLKALAGDLETKMKDGIVFIINVKDGALGFVSKANVSLKDKINVGLLVKDASLLVDGNGGGSASFAQGGGPNISQKDFVINYVKEKIINRG